MQGGTSSSSRERSLDSSSQVGLSAHSQRLANAQHAAPQLSLFLATAPVPVQPSNPSLQATQLSSTSQTPDFAQNIPCMPPAGTPVLAGGALATIQGTGSSTTRQTPLTDCLRAFFQRREAANATCTPPYSLQEVGHVPDPHSPLQYISGSAGARRSAGRHTSSAEQSLSGAARAAISALRSVPQMQETTLSNACCTNTDLAGIVNSRQAEPSRSLREMRNRRRLEQQEGACPTTDAPSRCPASAALVRDRHPHLFQARLPAAPAMSPTLAAAPQPSQVCWAWADKVDVPRLHLPAQEPQSSDTQKRTVHGDISPKRTGLFPEQTSPGSVSATPVSTSPPASSTNTDLAAVARRVSGLSERAQRLVDNALLNVRIRSPQPNAQDSQVPCALSHHIPTGSLALRRITSEPRRGSSSPVRVPHKSHGSGGRPERGSPTETLVTALDRCGLSGTALEVMKQTILQSMSFS